MIDKKNYGWLFHFLPSCCFVFFVGSLLSLDCLRRSSTRVVFFVGSLLIISSAICAAPTTQPQFQQALAPRQWSFPRDHGRHDGFKTEWWYFTGNLADAKGRQFGFQLTFFRSALLPEDVKRPSPWAMNDLYFAHAAISDVAGQRFFHADRLSRGRAGLALASDRTLDVELKDWSCKLDDRGIHLLAEDPDMKIDLLCGSGRGPILQGPGGVNPKGTRPGQASYYYSMTRLPTSGTLTVRGNPFTVTGTTWMDHEFSSNALADNQSGWDWLALSLTDGHDLMIYRLRNKSGGTDYLSGTVIAADGKTRFLKAAEIALSPSKPWTSPVSGGVYPLRWKVAVAGLPSVIVASRIPDQEMQTPDSTRVTYYEGTVDVRDDAGKSVGSGYLEMTGYAHSLGGAF